MKIIVRDEFVIKDRDQVFTLNLEENGFPKKVARQNIKDYFNFNDIVEYNDKKWQIKGIESFATFEIADVGLLVEEVPQKLNWDEGEE